MRIGVISASSGAAIHDIFTTITRRWPISERILIPASVQGLSAAPTIVNALKLADTLNFDVIILARGGGSLEDLWPFNEEIVARAIFEMKTPVVSGVGHEVDFTISDFVSDKRAPTPTGAAEMVTPDINEIRLQVNNLKSRILNNFNNILKYNKQNLNNIKTKNIFVNPEFLYVNSSIILDNYKNKLITNYHKLANNLKNKNLVYLNKMNLLINNKISSYNYLYNYNEKLNLLFNKIYSQNLNNFKINISKLDSLSPLKVMSRGYSYVTKENEIIKSINEVKKDDELELKLVDGKILTKVIDVKEK